MPKEVVVRILRIQIERGAAIQGLSDEAYLKQYGLTKERYAKMNEKAIIMHPAPVNRGIELADDLVLCPQSRIFQQMHNGVFMRMAMLEQIMQPQATEGSRVHAFTH